MSTRDSDGIVSSFPQHRIRSQAPMPANTDDGIVFAVNNLLSTLAYLTAKAEKMNYSKATAHFSRQYESTIEFATSELGLDIERL